MLESFVIKLVQQNHSYCKMAPLQQVLRISLRIITGKILHQYVFPYVSSDYHFGEILYLFKDSTRDIRSNITLCLKEFRGRSPRELLKAKGYM